MPESYYRPKSIQEALQILSNTDKSYLPLGGGSVISRMNDENVAVVDLADLDLDRIETNGNFLDIGATTTLDNLYHNPDVLPGLLVPIYREASFNIRQQASVAGSIVSADGRSSLAVALMALDAELIWMPRQVKQRIGEWFSLRQPAGKFIVTVRIPLNVELGYESVSRTPLDLPIVSVAVSRWPSGRVRVALGGCGKNPILALDGPEAGGVAAAVRNAFAQAGDQWASREYRQDVSEKLALRILNQMSV